MVAELEGSMGYLDAVCCETKCIGWDREGMDRYVEWQNSVLTPSDFRRHRFVEIPSLMQSLVCKADALLEILAGNGGVFMDDRNWCIDYHFWLTFFSLGKECRRLPPGRPRFLWRQHPGQQTRSHGRLSIENLRRCKCEFIVSDIVAYRKLEQVEVWSVGKTLDGWCKDLRSAIIAASKESKVQVLAKKWGTDELIGEEWHSDDRPPPRTARLFAFGSEKIRKLVTRNSAKSWDDELDWFVA